MHSPDTTLVCFAVKEEARPFKFLAANRPEIRVLITGMGARNAEQSVKTALATEKPGMVISCGFAGGLRPDLATGMVVFGGALDPALEKKLLRAGAQRVLFHFAERVATTSKEKRNLRELTGADAVEMESKAICDLCAERNIPSAIVRVVLDTVEDDLPLDFNALLNEEQRIDGLKLAGVLLKSPGKIRALLRLRKQSDSAAKRLAAVLGAIL